MNEYEHCTLCPRMCGVNRVLQQKGYCGAVDMPEVGRAALHMWEEPCISGKNGSGTVFFAHCTLGCVYCQNRSISKNDSKCRRIDDIRLSEIFLELQKQGAHNINLVTPMHYAPSIKNATIKAKKNGLIIPVLINCGGYENDKTVRSLNGLIDIYLPDFKYYSGYYAKMYSNAEDYREITENAIDEMVKQTGAVVLDENGIMKKGTIIRHLILPGMINDTKQVLRKIAEKWGDLVYVSLMRQYTPFDMQKYPELDRTISSEEYEEAVYEMKMLGLCGFLQEEGTAKQSFIPSFNGEGV